MELERGDDFYHSAYVAIVDDLEINRRFLENLSSKVEDISTIRTFSSAETALQNFRKTHPDLIITDFGMPGMDAAAFLQELRTIAGLEETPVIVVSGNEKAENRRRALLCGATDFLTTPFDTFEFQVRVRNLLRLGLHQKLLRTNSITLKQKLTQTRLRSIKATQESRERFTNVIDCVPAIVFAVRDGGQCVFANEYCFEFFGNEGEAAFQSVLSQLGGVRISRLEPTEITIKDKKGKDYTFLMMSRVVPQSPTQEGLLVYSGIDVSTLKQTEQCLRIAKSEAESANQAKSAFLANMSHEVRTPLNAIIGFAEMIFSETFGPIQNDRYRGYIQDILNSSKHLLFIINEILDFSQIEQGQHSLSITEFSLLDCIIDLRRMIEIQLQSKRNKLIVNSSNDFDVKTDSQKLSQVMLNIIANANKFMEDGIIRIEVCQNDRGEIQISVEDHGIGMTEEELAIAVSNFGRIANPKLSSSDQGIGLGLPISTGFMRLLGGRLEILSKKGTGTRVDLILPASAVVGPKPATLNLPRLLLGQL
jgi:two-component system cell cycle sensor histidine kinase PleC